LVGHRTGSKAYRELLSTGHFWRVFTVSILVNPCLYFLLNWLPTFLSQQRGVAADKLQWDLTLMYLGLDLGYLFCGAGVLVLTKMAWPLGPARRAVFWIATLLLSSTALVPYADTLHGTLALLTAANFGAGCWIAMYLTMAQEVSSVHLATAAGLLGGSGSLAGAFAMWAVGYVTQETSSFSGPLFGIALAAIIAALAGNAVVRGAWTGQERHRTD
jgi:ACS family D-galactonate transporter-like MFS transporter